MGVTIALHPVRPAFTERLVTLADSGAGLLAAAARGRTLGPGAPLAPAQRHGVGCVGRDVRVRERRGGKRTPGVTAQYGAGAAAYAGNMYLTVLRTMIPVG